MINLQNASLLRGSKHLLKDATLTIHPKEKVGLVGANGCGKSSLFLLLLGQCSLDLGDLSIPKQWRIGHMRQEISSARSAVDFVIDGDTALRTVEASLADPRLDGEKLAAAYAHYEELGGYSAEAKASQLLTGLGFSTAELSQPVNAFSGGWRVRIALAQALMCPSDLLLLDEPTNHLDLHATLWLEQWLKQYQGTLVIVSHDRDFLDHVVTCTVHIENQRLNRYAGGYSDFERQRSERMAQQQQLFNKQQIRVKEINDFVARFRAKASKAKQAQSRLKELQRMEMVEAAHSDSQFHFQIPCATKLPPTLATLSQAELGYPTFHCLHNINLSIHNDSRIGLLGPNGAGKSTLLKSLAGELPLLAGDRIASDDLRIGYFAQHQVQALDLSASPLLHLQRISPNAREQEMRNFLGGFAFNNDQVFATIGNFSGGEKARLTLAIIAWQKPNLLILDEPTNHLDLEMRHALTVALQAFNGAIMVVSHDRHLLRNTAEELILVHDGQVEAFRGDLNEYEAWLLQQDRLGEAGANTAPSGDNNGNRKSQRQQAAQDRARVQPLTQQLKKTEKELEKLQSNLASVTEQLTDTALYDNHRKKDLQVLLDRQTRLKQQIANTEEAWLALQDEIEQGQQA